VNNRSYQQAIVAAGFGAMAAWKFGAGWNLWNKPQPNEIEGLTGKNTYAKIANTRY